MHGVLQGFGQDSIPHFKKTSYARKIGTYLPGTFHSDAVSRLKRQKQKNKMSIVAFSSFLLYFIAMWWMRKTFDDNAEYFSNFSSPYV